MALRTFGAGPGDPLNWVAAVVRRARDGERRRVLARYSARPGAAAPSPVTAPAFAGTRGTERAAAGADRPHGRPDPSPTPTVPTAPRSRSPGTATDRSQGRSRPSRRQALPSSPVHSCAPDGPAVSAKTLRECRRFTSGRPDHDVAHDRRQPQTDRASRTTRGVIPRWRDLPQPAGRSTTRRRNARLTALAAVGMWRTATAEQLAAITGLRTVLDGREMRPAFQAELVERAPCTPHSAGAARLGRCSCTGRSAPVSTRSPTPCPTPTGSPSPAATRGPAATSRTGTTCSPPN